MTLANVITLVRLGLIPPLIAELLLGQRAIAFGLLIAILLGDLVDGALARWRREVTPLGNALDPLVDKLLFASLIATLAWQGSLPWIAFALLAFQQLALLSGALALRVQGQSLIAARPLGKSASAVLGLSVILMVWEEDPGALGLGLLYVGIGLTYLAAVDYALCLRANLQRPRARNRLAK